MDDQIRRVDKAFKAVEAQAGKAQWNTRVIPTVAYSLAKGGGLSTYRLHDMGRCGGLSPTYWLG